MLIENLFFILTLFFMLYQLPLWKSIFKYITCKGYKMEIIQCTSLEEVRKEVDKLDDELVELIAKRNSYIKQAAAFKESIEEVKAPERIDAVMQRVRHKALSFNLSPNLISKLYGIMINEMVESEIAEFRNGGNF